MVQRITQSFAKWEEFNDLCFAFNLESTFLAGETISLWRMSKLRDKFIKVRKETLWTEKG